MQIVVGSDSHILTIIQVSQGVDPYVPSGASLVDLDQAGIDAMRAAEAQRDRSVPGGLTYAGGVFGLWSAP